MGGFGNKAFFVLNGLIWRGPKRYSLQVSLSRLMNLKGYKLCFDLELIGSPVWVGETVETCKCSSHRKSQVHVRNPGENIFNGDTLLSPGSLIGFQIFHEKKVNCLLLL